MTASVVDLEFRQLAVGHQPGTLPDHGYRGSISRGVRVPIYFTVYSPTFAGTHCAFPPRDGQA